MNYRCSAFRDDRAAGLLLGFAADRLLGDPRRLHPVAGFGAVAAGLERKLYADRRAPGTAYAVLLVGGAVLLGRCAERLTRGRPAARTLTTATVTWAVLGGRSLEREALAVHALLRAGDLPAARLRLTHLVGRDTRALDASEIARAAVESVAENTSDAVVAPLLWGAVAGVPGLVGYRAANTLDAMVGHHNSRYERFGWASARLDDLAGLPGSRLTGLLTLAVRPARAPQAWRAWRRDAPAHASPNAGVVEAAFAGALGVRLGGTNTYRVTVAGSRAEPCAEHRAERRIENRIEHRAALGDGPPARPEQIAEAVRLARRVSLAAVLACAVALSTRRRVAGARPRKPIE